MFFLFLAGCSEPEPAEILEAAKQAEEELKSVEMEIQRTFRDETVSGNSIFDFDNSVDYYTLGESDMSLYRDEDDLLLEYENDLVIDAMEQTEFLPNELDSLIDSIFENMKMPLAFIQELDADIFNKFDMEIRDNDYLFTYNAEQTEKEELARGILQQSEGYFTDEFGMEVEVDPSDVMIDSFSLELIIEKEKNWLLEMEQGLAFSVGSDNFSDEEHFTYTYFNHDKAETIEKPTVTVFHEQEEEELEEDTDSTDTASLDSLTEEEIETLETEAAAYVDALIQATVFQNAEEFINRAPESYSEDEKESSAEIQTSFFRESYFQNTKQSMGGLGITDEEINELTDAFLHALSTTKYEVVGANTESADTIIVTVSVEGISDTAIYTETEDELMEIITSGEVPEEELISKNLEILTDKYYNIDELLDPVEVDVHVNLNSDGTYMVYLQDQYLAGFVQ